MKPLVILALAAKPDEQRPGARLGTCDACGDHVWVSHEQDRAATARAAKVRPSCVLTACAECAVEREITHGTDLIPLPAEWSRELILGLALAASAEVSHG